VPSAEHRRRASESTAAGGRFKLMRRLILESGDLSRRDFLAGSAAAVAAIPFEAFGQALSIRRICRRDVR